MSRLSNFALAISFVSIGLQVLVVALLFAHGSWRRYPAFCCYLVANILESGFVCFIYVRYGSFSTSQRVIAWLAQIPVTAMRAWVLVELWRDILAKYKGIWGLAWRICAVVAVAFLSV